MKSPMLEANPDLMPDKFISEEFGMKPTSKRYSDLKIMSSAAGYYIGTSYEELDAAGKVVWQEPGSRDSDYFKKIEQAQKFLNKLEAGTEEEAAQVLRKRP